MQSSREVAKDDGALPADVLDVARAHLRGPGARREGFRDGVVVGADARAIYLPGGTLPGFYEIPIATEQGERRGYMVVSATSPRVIEYADRGVGPSARLEKKKSVDRTIARVVRLDTALYVAEDAAGEIVAQTARSIAKIARTERRAELVPVDARSVMREAPTSVRGFWDWFSPPAPPARTCSIPGSVPKYVQIGSGSGPNSSSCLSGCGPTAWSMVFGWASKRAHENPADAAYAGLFREGGWGAVTPAPDAQDGNVEALTWQLRDELSTFCLTDQGATPPWSMAQIAGSVSARTDGVGTTVDWNTFMLEDTGVRDTAINAICDGRPAILGIGTMFAADMHYPVASAYEDGWFYLEMGWGGAGDAWYWTGTWFAGSVYR